jgi:hypothetical protein
LVRNSSDILLPSVPLGSLDNIEEKGLRCAAVALGGLLKVAVEFQLAFVRDLKSAFYYNKAFFL